MRTVDTADWSQSERDGINWGTPYVVTCAPYGETVAREFATQEEAEEFVSYVGTLQGTYATSWGHQEVNTEATLTQYVDSTPAYLPPIIRNLKRATRTRYSVRDLDTLEVLGTDLTHDEADEIVYARQGTYSVVNETYRATYGDRGSETIVYYGAPTTPVPIPPIPSYAPAHMFTYSVYSDGRFVGSCAGDAREELDALITARNGDAVTLDRFQEESTPSGWDI